MITFLFWLFVEAIIFWFYPLSVFAASIVLSGIGYVAIICYRELFMDIPYTTTYYKQEKEDMKVQTHESNTPTSSGYHTYANGRWDYQQQKWIENAKPPEPVVDHSNKPKILPLIPLRMRPLAASEETIKYTIRYEDENDKKKEPWWHGSKKVTGFSGSGGASGTSHNDGFGDLGDFVD